MGIFNKLFGIRSDVEELKRKGDVRGLINALYLRKGVVWPEALFALISLNDPRSTKPLIKALRAIENDHTGGSAGDPRPGMKAAILRALGRMREPSAVPILIENIRFTYVGGMSSVAAEVLGDIGDSRAIEPLIATLERGDFGDSTAIALERALLKFGEAALEPLLAALSKDSYWVIRVLGKLGDRRAIEPLLAFSRDVTKNGYHREQAEFFARMIERKMSSERTPENSDPEA